MQEKRTQNLTTNHQPHNVKQAVPPCGVGQYKEGMKRPDYVSKEDWHNFQRAASGCVAGCSCTHIFDISNKILGANI